MNKSPLQKRLLEGFIDFNTSPSSLKSPNEIHLSEIATDAFIEYLDLKIRKICLNAAYNDGVCDLLFRHDACCIIMDMLFELTLEERYKHEYTKD